MAGSRLVPVCEYLQTSCVYGVLVSDWFIVVPIGRYRGVSDKPARLPEKNDILEKTFTKQKKAIPRHNTLEALSKQTDLSVRQIERWWKLRKLLDKPTDMQKLGETSFRCLMYIIIFSFCCFLAWGQPYLWDTRHCWYNYPKQNVTSHHMWFWCLEVGCYIAQVLSAGIDNRKKDFLEMMLHHVTCLVMFFISWLMNFIPVSVLCLVIHDGADPLLDAAKVARYLKIKTLPDIIFVVFTVVWFFSRLVILPLWVGWTSFFEGHRIIGSFPGYWLLVSGYVVLQILHVYWFTFIIKVIYQYIILKEELKDNRSDTEPESENEDELQNGKENKTNINGQSHMNGKEIHHINGQIHMNGKEIHHINGQIHMNGKEIHHINGKTNINGKTTSHINGHNHINGKVTNHTIRQSPMKGNNTEQWAPY